MEMEMPCARRFPTFTMPDYITVADDDRAAEPLAATYAEYIVEEVEEDPSRNSYIAHMRYRGDK